MTNTCRATICREKVIQWQAQNGRLSRQDYESEIKRLNRLLLSYTGLKQVRISSSPESTNTNPLHKALESDPTKASVTPKPQDQPNGGTEEGAPAKEQPNGEVANGTVKKDVDAELAKADTELKAAYQDLYKAQNAIPPNPIDIRNKQDALQKKLEAHSQANLAKNKQIAQNMNNQNASQKLAWVNSMIEDTNGQITLLKQGLQTLISGKSAAPVITEVVKTEVKSPGQTEGGELIATKYADDGDQNADASEYSATMLMQVTDGVCRIRYPSPRCCCCSTSKRRAKQVDQGWCSAE